MEISCAIFHVLFIYLLTIYTFTQGAVNHLLCCAVIIFITYFDCAAQLIHHHRQHSLRPQRPEIFLSKVCTH